MMSRDNTKVRIGFRRDHWFGFRHVIFKVSMGICRSAEGPRHIVHVEEPSADRQQLKQFQCLEDRFRRNRHPGKFQPVRSRPSVHAWVEKTRSED